MRALEKLSSCDAIDKHHYSPREIFINHLPIAIKMVSILKRMRALKTVSLSLADPVFTLLTFAPPEGTKFEIGIFNGFRIDDN